MFGDPKDINEFKESSGYTIDGLWYPRVTKIVTIKAKPALYYYYGEAKSYRAANESTEQSAREGTMIHEAAEAILLGKDPEIPKEIKGAITSFKEFLAKTPIGVTPELVERRIVNRDHRYAGTVDAIATIDGKLGVLDIKTSASIYRDYCLQTSAYMDALKDDFPELSTRWILRIDQLQKCVKCGALRRMKGGNEKIKTDWHNGAMRICTHQWGEPYGDIELREFPSWHSDFQAFLAAKRLWEWENETWLKKIAYL
jgi:hypothetical protein